MPLPAATSPLRVAYFFTRFPHLTETFLQREVRAMRELGVDLQLFSWHGGGAGFEGLPVTRFSKWTLLTLFWRAFAECWRQPRVAIELARRLFLTWPRDWLNHWENLYGAGIAAVVAEQFRRARIDHIHAVWASLPATAAWVLSRFTGIPFSIGAHAYDLFEHGGDWFLREKCAAAKFVHTSTDAGSRRLQALGVPAECIVMARRGLEKFPPCREPRPTRVPLHVLCIARLVEKKGLLRQLGHYRHWRDAGLEFTATIVGDGPLRPRLEAEIRAARLGDRVFLKGEMPMARVWDELREADVLVHTGLITSTGDRDGLPNVVPEAMAAGVIVVTAPAEGVLEAIAAGQTGLVCALDDPAAWLAAMRRVQVDTALVRELRGHARRWVEENFDAKANAARILAAFRAPHTLASRQGGCIMENESVPA